MAIVLMRWRRAQQQRLHCERGVGIRPEVFAVELPNGTNCFLFAAELYCAAALHQMNAENCERLECLNDSLGRLNGSIVTQMLNFTVPQSYMHQVNGVARSPTSGQVSHEWHIFVKFSINILLLLLLDATLTLATVCRHYGHTTTITAGE